MSGLSSFRDKLAPGTPKKLLALDGGGILGTISIEYLSRIEDLLRRRLGRDESFALADYFDYVAGTSTGAIIATCVALGMRADQIREFYHTHGKEMFDRDWLFRRFRHRYTDHSLAEMLRKTIAAWTGEADATLGSGKLRTLLMVVLRNATTDSPWPVSNNPAAKYNAADRADCNLHLPLWQLVRGSTAAPTYFPPEVVTVGPKEFVFVDGGVTVFNNPALQLFLMATVDAYRLGWPAGEEKMLLVSVGTGTAPNANADLRPGEMNLLYSATRIPSALMGAANAQQDVLCRVLGKCVHGGPIDREVGALLHPAGGPVGPGKLFTYARYDADVTQEGIDALGLTHIRAADVQQMDSVKHIAEMAAVGRAAADRQVSIDHFEGFLG